MKRFTIVSCMLVASLVLTGAGCKKTEKQPKSASDKPSSNQLVKDQQRYEVESGKITYTFEGMRTGTEELVFKDYGWKEAATTKTKLSFGEIEDNQLRVLDGYTQYTVDLNNNTATEIDNLILKKLVENNTEDSLTALGEAMLEEMGAIKGGTKMVAGHECTIWEMSTANVSQCVYKGVTLEIVSDFGGMSIVQTATSVEFDIDISDDEFALPDGVEITQTINAEDLLQNL